MYFSAKFAIMKKIIYLLLSFVLIITGCNEKTDFILKGQISGLLSDTLIVYYQLPEYKTDTIICKNGAFEYTFSPDTTTVFTLIYNGTELVPIFAEKNQNVKVEGTVTDFTIKGQGENKLMNEIISLLRNTPKESVMHTVDSLINANNYSFTNLYLIDNYYTRQENPDFNHLKKLIEKQSGIIKDTPYIMDLQTKINTNTNRSQTLHTMYGKDREGKSIKWPTNRDNYILIDFWASWHPESVAAQDSLTDVIKALRKENFLIFSISLDLDKEAWLKASDRDTTQWYQVCDFRGWNNSIVKSHNIQTLPTNLLLDKNKRVIARNIRGKELIDKVKTLIQEDKEIEKKKTERKRKKQL